MWFVMLFLYRPFENTWSDGTQTDPFKVSSGRINLVPFLRNSSNEYGYFRHLLLHWNKCGWVEAIYVPLVLDTVASKGFPILVSLIILSISLPLLHDVAFRFSHLMFFVINPWSMTIMTKLTIVTQFATMTHFTIVTQLTILTQLILWLVHYVTQLNIVTQFTIVTQLTIVT
jgi:hypothetical protein